MWIVAPVSSWISSGFQPGACSTSSKPSGVMAKRPRSVTSILTTPGAVMGSLQRLSQALDVALGTVFNVKRRFAEGGLEGVLKDKPQAHRHRKMDDRAEAHLIALACSPAPEGHEHWNLRLLADRMVELGVVESLSYETVRLHLKKTPSSRGRRSSGAFPR